MIIELHNFGPIKSFSFDTDKDIHAIFGKNNIGKSYAISAVYLILKGLREFRVDSKEYHLFNSELTLIIAHGKDGTIIERYNSGIINYLDSTFIQNFNQSLENTFDINTYQNYKTDIPASIKICFKNHEIDIRYNANLSKFKIFDVAFGSYLKLNKNKEPYELSIFDKKNVLLDKSNVFFNHDAFDAVYLSLQYFVKVIKNELALIYYLPASRSGLYNALNSFGAIFAELSRNRNFIRNKIEIPNIAEPISDYFLNLNTIDKAQANEHYLTHFEEIEQEILKGKITLDNETKKYYYVPTDTDMRLELSFTSSMISEIAPIIAHLKYIIPLESDKPSILFIEEPEAHLHPEIQILLIEYFVKLSKGNVKIVMTSHSNYIFNKLSNLLIAKRIDANKLSVSLMKMTPEGSVIEEGAMQMDEYGIEDNNFVDVAEQLYEERMSLLEKL